MVKLHDLYYKIDIEKETEKAVFVKPRKINNEKAKEINSDFASTKDVFLHL